MYMRYKSACLPCMYLSDERKVWLGRTDVALLVGVDRVEYLFQFTLNDFVAGVMHG